MIMVTLVSMLNNAGIDINKFTISIDSCTR